MQMKKRILTILQYIFFFGLGIFLVWWSIKDLSKADRSEIRQAMKHARYLLIIPIFGILLFSHYIRALRWKLLIEPLGYSTKTSNAFFAVMIGYLTNLAIPRMGEILKCTALARYEKTPVDKLIGTVILERIIDSLCLLVVFGITLAIQPELYAELIDALFHSSTGAETKKTSAYIILIIIAAIIILAISAWMIFKKKSFKDLITLLKKVARSIWQGISTIEHLKKRKRFIILTIILWSIYLAGGYIGFQALKETESYGIKEAFTILSAGAIGMIITPGGIGAYAILLEKSMQLYGLQKGVALAFGWIFWVAQTSVILIGGLFSFVAMPYFNKKKI